MHHPTRSTLPLVRSTDAQIQSLVNSRLKLYEQIRETATPTDPIVTFGPLPGSSPSSSSPNANSSPSSIDQQSPITPGSGIGNITCSLPSEVTDSWHNPWFMSSQEDNDEALKAFIKQPVSPEMISYLAIKTEQILELPEPTEEELRQHSEPQWPPLRHFIATIVSKAEVRTGALMSTLVYLERFRKFLGPGVRATVGIASHHRIFFACLILTCKYLHDSNLKNKCWAKCSIVSDWICRTPDGFATAPFQLKTNDVNLMEKEMLARLNWSLAITENDLYAHLDFFLAPIRGRNQATRLMAAKSAALQKSAVDQIRTAVSNEQLNSWHYPTVLPVPQAKEGVAESQERTPSLSPPGLIPSSAASSRRTQYNSLATPVSVSTNATTPMSSKRRSLLHCRSLVSLSSISPIGKARKSASGVGLNNQVNNSSSNLLKPTDNNHPYATYGRGSKASAKHSHTHSTASTISTFSNEPGSRLSLNQTVPQFGQNMFRPQSSYSTNGSNRTSWLGSSTRHPHIRQSSSLMDQNMFETVIDLEQEPNISDKLEAGQGQGLPYSMPMQMMGVPSVQRPGPGPIQTASPTPAQQSDVKSSRMSSFWSRIMTVGLGRN